MCDEKAAISRRRSRRRQVDEEMQATRAEMFIQLGKLSSARRQLGESNVTGQQALEGCVDTK